ncbi:MAG TPA: PadR family transcriptional regulator [Acidobacteriaceae bacterium]|nr:PadR family transcriptional regulator [Acidobacteriaceae bacterium]
MSIPIAAGVRVESEYVLGDTQADRESIAASATESQWDPIAALTEHVRHTPLTSILRYLYKDIFSMAKADALQGSLDLLVLKILSRRPRLHGYAIMAAVANTSGEVLRAEEGSLYPALHRMEEAGWIRAEWIKKDSGRRARVYELTAAGKKQLGLEESRWRSVSLAINRVLREA